MAPRGAKSKYWAFTYNNVPLVPGFLDDFKKTLLNLNWLEDAGFQIEVAPTTGTIHLQGHLKLSKINYKSYLNNSVLNKRPYDNKIWWEPARNIEALDRYCQKVQEGAHGFWSKKNTIESIEQAKRDELAKELSFQTNIPAYDGIEYGPEILYDDDGIEYYRDYISDEQYVSKVDLLNSDLKELALTEDKASDISGQTKSDCQPSTDLRPTAGINKLPNYHDKIFVASHPEWADSRQSSDQIEALNIDHPFVCQHQLFR